MSMAVVRKALARHRWMPVIGVLLLASAVLPAAERISWSADHKPLATALGELAQLSVDAPSLAFDIATGAGATRPATLVLRQAEPLALRQAVAHAAGLWWVVDPTTGRASLTADGHLPRGVLRVRAHPTGLLRDAEVDTAVRTLIAPWLGRPPGGTGGDATITYDPANGTWTAVLDADGQAQLVDLLSLLQLPRPQVPDLVPDAETPDPRTPVAAGLDPGSWSAWATALSTALGGSVSLAPGLDSGATAPAMALAGSRGGIAAALASAGLQAAAIHGVWCIGRSAPEDRQHPALRRRIAVLPIPHLAADDAAGLRIASAVRAALGDATWRNPGWDLRWSPPSHGLLVAADAASIHRVLDALDVLDRLGPAAGGEALAQPVAR